MGSHHSRTADRATQKVTQACQDEALAEFTETNGVAATRLLKDNLGAGSLDSAGENAPIFS